MNPIVAAFLSVLPVLLKEGPEIVAAVEKILGDHKANFPEPAGGLANQVAADTKPLFDELGHLKGK